MRKRLLLIGSLDDVVQRAKQAGFYVILFQQQKWLFGEQYKTADETFVFDWSDINYTLNLAKTIHAVRPLDAVFSFGEQNILVTARIASELNLPGNPVSAVEMARDKSLMREAFAKRRLSPVQFRKVSTQAQAVVAAAEIGYPVIVKPCNGWASIGVHKLDSKAELDHVFEHLQTACQEQVMIVEEFLDGNELSVEAITIQGHHEIVAITQKYTTGAPNFIETGHTVPALLPNDQIEEIKRFTQSVLDAIGHTLGPSHTEIRVTPQGLRVIETHTRPGGDHIPSLVKLSGGVDVFQAVFQYLHDGVVPLQPRGTQGCARVAFLMLGNGMVTSIEGIEEVRRLEYVYDLNVSVKIGDQVSQPTDSFTRHGHLIVVADSHKDLEQHVRTVRNLLRITVNGKPCPSAWGGEA